MKTSLFFASFIVLIPMIASAQTEPTYDVMGAGTQSCGTWTFDRAHDSSSLSDNLEEEWILGFVIANEIFFATSEKKNMTITTDAKGIFGFIDNYCGQNPSDKIVVAALDFVVKSNTIQHASN